MIPSDRPIRLLQINTFYDGFLKDVYANDPTFAAKAYDTQVEMLLASGFAAPHIMSGTLGALGWNTAQLIINATDTQLAWWTNTRQPGQPNSLDDIGRAQVATCDPDILYINNCHHYDSGFVRSLDKKPKLVVGWSGFPPLEKTDWSAFDIVLTSFDKMFDWATERGAKKVIRFYPGFPKSCPVLDSPRTPEFPPLTPDVVFSGSVTEQHAYRVQLLNYLGLMSQSPAPDGFSFGLFMPSAKALDPMVQRLNQGAVWGDEMIATLRRAKIVVNIDIDAFDNQPPNMRLIEATGAGTLLLTPHHPELPKFFEPGVEIETFRNPDELMAKLHFYLQDDAAREEIALNGQKRCLADHELTDRASWLKEILEAELAAQD